MSLPSLSPAAAMTAVCVVLFPGILTAQTPKTASNELDAFMEKVLQRREVNRQTLNEYVLDEVEGFEILGPGRMPLHRSRRRNRCPWAAQSR